MHRYLPLIAIAVFAVGVSSSRSVHASCGDWLAHPGEMSLAAVENPADEVPPSPRRCNGPLCRQSPSGPIPTPTPTSPKIQRDYSVAICDAQRKPELSLMEGRIETGVFFYLPSGHGMPIERPPQV
ncbi:MAG: hypothetical protein KDB00_02895 [Planctomycetales bacterium]|nr:hypothetical protein [Planctomycetales bacterium]